MAKHASEQGDLPATGEVPGGTPKVRRLAILGDRAAIFLSGLCIVHCIALPVFLLVFPTLTLWHVDDEAFHLVMLYLVVPISLLALISGYRQHKKHHLLGLGLSGLMVLAISAFVDHDVIGHHGELLLTVTGSIMVALSHYYNARSRIRKVLPAASSYS